MDWLPKTLELLARQPVCDYFPTGSGASEPSALAAIALIGHGRTMAAKPVGEFLVSLQTSFGCVGMRAKESEPHWATSLALLVWKWLGDKDYGRASDAALNWTLHTEGERIPRRPDLGHNSTLAAWPWVEGTHSWLEPSALFTIALKVYNLRDLPRTKEAVELLLDRLLPSGGCNYGNTTVLGQMLRPHVQPSGIVTLALKHEQDISGRLARTLDYLSQACTRETTPHSLAWALLGLAAHDRSPGNAASLLEEAYLNTMQRGGSLYTLALLANAALGAKSPLIIEQHPSLL